MLLELHAADCQQQPAASEVSALADGVEVHLLGQAAA